MMDILKVLGSIAWNRYNRSWRSGSSRRSPVIGKLGCNLILTSTWENGVGCNGLPAEMRNGRLTFGFSASYQPFANRSGPTLMVLRSVGSLGLALSLIRPLLSPQR